VKGTQQGFEAGPGRPFGAGVVGLAVTAGLGAEGFGVGAAEVELHLVVHDLLSFPPLGTPASRLLPWCPAEPDRRIGGVAQGRCAQWRREDAHPA
jgi:hypothetical protein